MRIYIANLPYDTTEAEVEEKFAAYGRVESVDIIEDHKTGKSRGFAFVLMPTFSEARAAVEGLNGTTIGDRTVDVSRAKPQNSGNDNNRMSYGKKRTGNSRGFGGRGFGGGRMKRG